MLLIRSNNLFKIFLIFAIVSCSTLAQHYDGEYDGDDHSSYESDSSEEPDYSKYYAGDGGGSAAALTDVKSSNGFVNPAEFSSFFSPTFYAASNKQEVTKDPTNGFVNSQDFQTGFADFRASPFGGKDFFEQAAQQQNAQQTKPNTHQNLETYEIKPGPSYVSHKIVPPAPLKPVKKSKYESEIDDLNKPYGYKNQNLNSQDEQVIPLYSGAKQKIVDPKYLPQYTPKKQNNPTPYQKYSFQSQPGTLSTFASASTGKLTTSPAYNANYDYLYTPSTNNEYKLAYDAAATNVNSKLQDFNNFKPSQLIKECKKVNKHAPGTSKNSKPMDCYVCKDAKGISYEECFYGQASESNPKNYYIETSKEYTEPTQVKGYNFNRYKRYTVNDNAKDDPYEILKKQSERYYNSPDFGSSYKHPKSHEDDYRFGGDGEEKSSSEQIADQLVKSGENCRKVNKDGMTCTICENKKTGGNYEQCSYSTAPEEKKYAYSKQRKYNREDEPTEETDSSEEQPVSNKKPQQFYKPKSETPKKQRYQNKQQHRSRHNDDSEEVERIKPVNTNRQVSEYTVPKHFANINVAPESAESEEEETHHYPDNEEYYYVVPSAPSHTSESKRDEQKQNAEDHESAEAEEEDAEPESHYGYYGEESKKDVEEVLAEFAKKDRSKCKKAEKNGMTCYLCVDKKGLQHEECMYVSESRPQSKYQAYHAQKETDGREGAAAPRVDHVEENAEESKVKSVRGSRPEPRLAETKYPDFAESTTESTQPPSRRRPKKAIDADVKRTNKDKSRSRIARRSYSDRLEEDSPVEESKDEYRVDGEKGAFSHETEPVFSKQYGVTLPKFMLEKSEGEKIYDDLAKARS